MRKYLFIVVLLQFLVSCAPVAPVLDKSDLLAYIPDEKEQTTFTQHHPVFIIEKPRMAYNRIGTPGAELTGNGKEKIYVDPQVATIYTEKRLFRSNSNTYTNLIYRIHFRETPYGLFPFQLGAGKNVGLIIIVTLNGSNQPVLYTSVHTCGCYLAFIPTTHLPRSAYPVDWPEHQQIVYSEILPSRLDPKQANMKESAVMILLRDASHRVKDIWIADGSTLGTVMTAQIEQQPLAMLEKLPIGSGSHTTSFYETAGAREGYVKGSHKPLERLLMSWWAFDWRIGEDKKLGRDKRDPPLFFTSLKPWAREASDLRDFPTFLQYWGWNL